MWRLALVVSLAYAAQLAACAADDAPLASDAGADARAPQDACAYPAGPYGATILDVTADVTFADGTRLSDLRRCGQPDAPKLLVLRLVTGSCGTCQWSAAHTAELQAEHVQLVDVLMRGSEGAPPTAADADRFGALRDADVRTLLDPSLHFRNVDPALTLPAFVFIDTRTMKMEGVLASPAPELVQLRTRQLLATIDGQPEIPSTSVPLYDRTFGRNEWEMIQAMALPADYAPPPDPSDAHADDPRAAALGAKLFDDVTLSPSGTVSCKLCHDPAHAFSDGLRTAEGVAVGPRNTPSLLFAAHQKWQFWDGRVDTLWAQALGPLENELEYGSSRLFVVHRIAAAYRTEFEAIYGALPDLTDASRFPAAGKPGQPAWDAMAAADRSTVTRAFTDVGKAFAAFERTLRAEDSALDRYARGDTTALDDVQKRGLGVFFTAGCAQCHYGPRLTDDAFHVVRFPTGRADATADVGRSEGLRLYAEAEFGAATVWSDSVVTRPESLALLGEPLLAGQFKTPGLRGVAVTAPYGHGGSEGDLDLTMHLYGGAGIVVSDPRAVGVTEPWVAKFDTVAQQQLARFLETMTAVRKPAP